LNLTIRSDVSTILKHNFFDSGDRHISLSIYNSLFKKQKHSFEINLKLELDNLYKKRNWILQKQRRDTKTSNQLFLF